jgi:integrase
MVNQHGNLSAVERASSAAVGVEAPLGFRDLRAHDLRHTFGRRLRSAGVSKEDRGKKVPRKSRRPVTCLLRDGVF